MEIVQGQEPELVQERGRTRTLTLYMGGLLDLVVLKDVASKSFSTFSTGFLISKRQKPPDVIK